MLALCVWPIHSKDDFQQQQKLRFFFIPMRLVNQLQRILLSTLSTAFAIDGHIHSDRIAQCDICRLTSGEREKRQH